MKLDPGTMDWQVINDSVMGGLTRSSARGGDEGVLFSGTLSTANKGGFASIRSRLHRPFRSLREVRLCCSGDGGRYQLRLRDSEDSSSAAWRAFFDTGAERRTVVLQTADFEPVVRGRRVVALPGLAERQLRLVGFMVTGDEPGSFALTVHGIELIGSESPA
jgi:NADH dehydrogenase [ubiquinone] 1 alpha subcomplex assembly factor 1